MKEEKNVTLQLFQHGIRKRETKNEVKEIGQWHSDILKERLKTARHIKSPPFSMIELEKVFFKSLITGKSKDPGIYVTVI